MGLTVGLATWCAAQVLPLVTPVERVACEAQLTAALAWKRRAGLGADRLLWHVVDQVR